MGRHQVYSVTVVAGNRAGSSQSFPGLIISESVLFKGMVSMKCMGYVNRSLCFFALLWSSIIWHAFTASFHNAENCQFKFTQSDSD